MALFTGEHQHTLDDKGRVILPAKFRPALETGLYFAPSEDRCIDVYPTAVFERRVEELRSRPREDRRARQYARVFMAGAHHDVPDTQGRVTIPPRLREYAQLDKDLTVVGNDERIEIWDRAAWDEYLTGAESAFAGTDAPFPPPSPT
ncbi:MAG TPA: division/cell wall cluster transcriptional repressor MraZ [Nitriliruptorales bacterium]